MPAFTPDERRGGLLVVVLLLIGAGWDAWRAASVPPPRAGGTTPTAQIAIPDSVEVRVRVSAASETGSVAPPRVDLNRADAGELDRLPGIGPVLAARIVEHRRRHGPFRSVDELRAVRGVGPRLLERLRPGVRAGS